MSILTSLSGIFAKADVEARFAAVVNKSYLASELSKMQSAEWELKREIPAFTWQGPMPIQIQTARAYLKTKISELNFVDESSLSVGFDGLKFDFLIEQLAIDTVVQHRVGNTVVNVKIKTECKNLNFSYDSMETTLDGNFLISEDLGSIIIRAQQLKLNMDPTKWSMSQFQCSNIEGIEDVISDQIFKAFFNESAPLEQLISNYIDTEGGALFAQLVNGQLQNISHLLNQFGTELSQRLISVKQTSEHFIAHMFSTLKSPRQEVLEQPKFSLDTEAVSLFLPKNLIEIMVEESILAQTKNPISSKDVPALDGLTNSRFSQFFFFPALMKLPAGSELKLLPTMQNLKVSLNDNAGVPQFKVTGYSGFWFKHQKMPIVFLRSPLEMTAKLLPNGISQPKVASFKISTHWDEEFLARYKPIKWIATSVIGTDLQELVKDKLAKTAWPQLELGAGATLRIKNITLTDNILEIGFH